MRWLLSLAFLSAASAADGGSQAAPQIKLWPGPPASAGKEVWVERGKGGVVDRSVATGHHHGADFSALYICSLKSAGLSMKPLVRSVRSSRAIVVLQILCRGRRAGHRRARG